MLRLAIQCFTKKPKAQEPQERAMPLIKVTSGAPNIPPGTTAATLISLRPKVINTADGEKDVLEWTFSTDNGEISAISSLNTGPKSKTFAFLVALLGKENVNIDDGFDEPDLVGKQALASIVIDDRGWPKIDALIPMPKGMKAGAAPARTTVAASQADEDDLPF
jgi:hypothetical protein